MIFESAEIQVVPGRERDFEAAVGQAVPLFRRSRGCRSMELHKVVEAPSKYRLVVGWDTVEDHLVHFRGSPEFQEWRRLVGPYFHGGAPVVDHTAVVVRGF